MSNFVSSQDKKATPTLSQLDEVLREGARTLLQQAIENEVAEYIDLFQYHKSADNRRIVTRNGYLPNSPYAAATFSRSLFNSSKAA